MDNTRSKTSADVYTHGHSPAVLRSHTSRTVDNSARYLVPRLRPGLSVLDIGCGPGTITADVAQRVAPGAVLGVDRSPAIIERAATEFEAIHPNLTFRVEDVYELSFDDNSFDVVHAHQVLQHLSNPVAALVEMGRVVAPGGVVAVRDVDYHAMTWFPESPELNRWMEIYQGVARRNKAEPDAGRRLLSWVRNAGFGRIEPSSDVWCFATDDERTWWGGLWADRMTSGDLADQAIMYGLADRSEMELVAAGWRAWSQEPDAWFVVVHAEILAFA